MKRAAFFLFVIALLQTGTAWAEEQTPIKTYSLGELFRIALERSEMIRIQEEDLSITEAGRDKALSFLMPKLSLFDDTRRYAEDKQSGAGQIIQPETTSTYGARVDYAMSLSGRELAGLRASKENMQRSRYDLESAREAYLFNVAAAYYGVLKAKKALEEIVNMNVKRLRKHRDAAASRLKVGEVTKTALLRAEAELSGAEAQAVNASNSLILLKAQLARIAAIERDFDLAEPPAEDRGTRLWLNLSSLRDEAFSKRPEIKSWEIKKKIAGEQIKYARGAYWPSVSLEGVYARKSDDPASPNLVKENIYAGIKLTAPIYDGGLKASDVREARSKLRQAELGLEDAKKAIAVEVEEAYLDLMTQSGVLASFEAQLAFARDNYDAVSRQFEFGLATSTDVMDANTLLVTAESRLADAGYNWKLAELKLDRATGTLLEKSLIKSEGPGKETVQ